MVSNNTRRETPCCPSRTKQKKKQFKRQQIKQEKQENLNINNSIMKYKEYCEECDFLPKLYDSKPKFQYDERLLLDYESQRNLFNS